MQYRPLLLLLCLSGAACDPCAGVANCGEAAVRYAGDLVVQSGEPPESMHVQFVWTDGVPMEPGTVSARANRAGRFLIDARASAPGEVTGDLLIYSGRFPIPDRVSGLRLETTSIRGDVKYLGSWVIPGLQVGGLGQLFYRAGSTPAADVEVEFRRTSGVPLVRDTFVVSTDRNGEFVLAPQALAAGTVIGELIVRSPAPYRALRIPDVRLSTWITVRVTPSIGAWLIGPFFPYVGRLVWGDTGAAAEDVEVEFRRVSGIAVEPQGYVVRSNSEGFFPIGGVRPLEYGELIGEVIVRPPAPYRSFSITDLRLETTEEDLEHAIQLGPWEIPRN